MFFVNFFIVGPDPGPLFRGLFVPTFESQTAFSSAVGLIGAVIMPHNLYLHSALVLSRKIDNKNPKAVYEANIYNAVESGLSLFISFLISFAVIGTFAYYSANPFYKDGEKVELDLSNAEIALESVFGKSAKYVWAIGLLAAGQSSTMTGTYAG